MATTVAVAYAEAPNCADAGSAADFVRCAASVVVGSGDARPGVGHDHIVGRDARGVCPGEGKKHNGDCRERGADGEGHAVLTDVGARLGEPRGLGEGLLGPLLHGGFLGRKDDGPLARRLERVGAVELARLGGGLFFWGFGFAFGFRGGNVCVLGLLAVLLDIVHASPIRIRTVSHSRGRA